MTSGHASHQMGLDADIWMLPPPLNLSPERRENILSLDPDRRGVAPDAVRGTPDPCPPAAPAARDPRVDRIFVAAAVKIEMCKTARRRPRMAAKDQPVDEHDTHFHVRLTCPRGSICDRQDPPPAGDGCAEAAEWIKNRIDPSRVKPTPPDPNYRHPRTFRLSEMPRECRTVAGAP